MGKVNPMEAKSTGWGVAALLIAALIAGSGSVSAETTCRISVATILASRDEAGVDPALQRHIGELQSMFTYTAYRLLGSETLRLKPGESGRVSLPGSRQLTITPHQARGDRADIALQMVKDGRRVFQTRVQLLNGGSLFVGGPKHANGNLIFKISGSY